MTSPRGGGFEYLHRIPASRRRRRKGNPVPGDITATHPGDVNTEPEPPGWGSLECETIKYCHESRWTRTRE
jgi:hypothetical protein